MLRSEVSKKMMFVSDYNSPNEMDLAFKLEGEGILPSQSVRERIVLSPACCTIPVQRMLLMQEMLVELSEELRE
ncbi:MAG: hypothetical protein XE11_1933 [Methanomicrobiales archaeon 53_19]|nr:MAG: hypothetical protein XE11_1933 [Methanomicrobiales archaeon 53_19]